MNERVVFADWPAPAVVIAGTTTRHGDVSDLPAPPDWLRQVHGNRAVVLGGSDFAAGEPRADAVITRTPGTVCAVRTADCLPVLLCHRDGNEIAAVHAGWRGLAAGIVDATVEALSARPEELLAWLGPAISKAAFEVGDEVREAFDAAGFDVTAHFAGNARGRWQADLFGLAAERLSALGVGSIHGERLCTFADPERFYSYRRDGETGRLISFVYLQDQG